MSKLKALAGQTAVYGLGTVVPRLLNFLLLTPFYTRIFGQGEYGIFSELYAYSAILLVVLTYGMETAYFRFCESEKDSKKVFTTSAVSLFITSVLFVIITVLLIQPIAGAINYENNPEYIILLAMIIATDAFTSIFFAKLRHENKAFKFAMIKLINIGAIVGFVFFFLYFCPKIYESNPDGSFINAVYSPGFGVGYAFVANLVGSLLSLIFLGKELFDFKFQIDGKLLKKMLAYSWPLIIVGLGGQINENIDKILLKYLSPEGDSLAQVGIYAASYKIAVFMTLYNQMFRYAAEPFFFSVSKEKDSKETYAMVMKYFVFLGLIIFLGITLFIDIAKYFIGSNFHEGLDIVPIVLLANLFFGILINLSIWYKLKNMTIYGAYLAIFGALITLIFNIVFIPAMGYMASAWATLICYFAMVLLSYILCMKFFPIPYETGKILFFIILSIGLFFIDQQFLPNLNVSNFIIKALMIIGFAGLFFIVDKKMKPKHS
jgi:O-antigen/teichoic acid export membrane protein